MDSVLWLLAVYALFAVAIQATHVKLPKGFVQCKQNDVEFDRCVMRASQLAIPELAKGQPKLGLPPIDPLRISNLFIDQGHGSVLIKLNFSDLDIHGLSKTELENIAILRDEHKIKLKLKVAEPVVLNGTYTINGKVLVLPISGSGYSELILEGFTAAAMAHFNQIEKNGDLHWHLTHIDFNFDTTKLIIRLDNLFNGDKALGDNMNKFLNENWQLLLEELKPAFKTALSTVFSDIAQRFFERVPITQVFPTQ